MAAAKAVALATGAPLVGVNHLEGHVWANFLEHGQPDPPYVALVVSGGHTMLVHIPEMFHHVVMGQTLDDAAGEAFDKVARLLGLGFPGGPALDRMARDGDPNAMRFPRAMEDSGDYDFSMSGLKTAVLRYVKARARGRPRPDAARPGRVSFQEAVVDVQVTKTIAAAKDDGAPTACCWGAAWWRTRVCASGCVGGGEAEGLRCSTRRSRCAPTTPRWSRAWGPRAGLGANRAVVRHRG